MDERIAEIMVSDLYWWGPPTLFRCPFDPDPANCDVALLGIPHSAGNGTTEKNQHLGPRALRNYSMMYRRVHLRWGLDPWSAVRIADVGDAPMTSPLVNDVAIREIEAFVRRIDEAGARPVAVGGDHSVSLAAIRGLAGPGSRVERPVALVHFDAHYDTYDDYPHWYGAKDSAGHWASISVHEGHVDASRSLQIGIRGHDYSTDPGHVSRELGYRIIAKNEFDDLGIDGTIGAIRERVGDIPVYISFDLDVLDPSIAPAVSNIEMGEGGLTMKEAIRTLQGMRGVNVIGADITELMPDKDARTTSRR